MRCSRHRSGTVLLLTLSLGVCGFAQEPFEERSTRLAKMSAVEKDELRRNHERLLKMEDPKGLRALEQALSADPNGDQLRKVMLRYQEWLRTLPSSERAALLSLPESERIPRIKELVEKQQADRSRELAKGTLKLEDIDKIRTWLGQLILKRKPDLLEHVPADERDRFARNEDPKRILFDWMMLQRDKPRPLMITNALRITDEDRQQLVSELSSSARDYYQREGTTEEKKQAMLQTWIFATFRGPSIQDLHEFLKRSPPEIRDRLENLPPEQMRAEFMRRFYDFRRWNPDGKRPPFGGDRPGDRPGDPRKGPPRNSPRPPGELPGEPPGIPPIVPRPDR